jgi:hypothetical protein
LRGVILGGGAQDLEARVTVTPETGEVAERPDTAAPTPRQARA